MCPPDKPDLPKPVQPTEPDESAELELEDEDRRRVGRKSRSGTRDLTIPLSIAPLAQSGLGGV